MLSLVAGLGCVNNLSPPEYPLLLACDPQLEAIHLSDEVDEMNSIYLRVYVQNLSQEKANLLCGVRSQVKALAQQRCTSALKHPQRYGRA